MGKALKTIGTIAAVVALVATGVGAAAGAGIAAAGIASAAAGVASVATLVSIAATVGGSLLTPAARRSLTAFDPKAINPDPASPRKLVFGQTTFVVDLRYAEPSGTNQEYIDYIFALAAHKSDAITEIYIEDDLAWTVGGGAQGKYVGYLTVEVILEAGSGAYHTVNAGTTWNSSTRLTGCTTMKVRVKRSDNSKSSQSPFASGISGRWAVIGRGIPVYDPAQDSTVAGGSGAQRAATQTTWAYTAGAARGNNPALQLLTYLLGWRIGGVVSVGCGLPVDTIDLPSFATAAALCDESVALADGGSQRRYEAGRAFADSDDPLAVIRTLLDAMNGELVDDGGRLSLRLAVNDLTAAYTLTDDDFVSGYSWKPAAPIEQQYTIVRGRYSAPGATLYGLVDYPEVAIARTSLAPRPLTLELSAVQEPRRAERIAKQAAQRNLYQGTFAVTLGVRGWLLRRNMVVAVTSSARGWTAKLFRVRSLGFNADATVEVVLREENAAIYAWSASESAQVTPVAPVVFDSRAAASWLMADIAAGANVTAPNAANRVPFSRMEGNQGYGVLYNPSSLANVVEYGEFQGLRFFKTTATATAAAQQISIGNAPSSAPAFKLTPGERVSVQARVEVAGAAAASYMFALWGFEVDGVTQAVIATVSGGVNYIGGGVVSFFADVPAWARQGRLELYGYSSGAGSFQVVISEPMVSGAVAGQTLHPAFTPGPNAKDGADVTAQNTSANSNALGGTAAATVANNITTAGTTALWPSVTGTGRPADNATVGAPSGTPVGSMSADDVSGRVSAAIDSSGLIINGRTLADRISGQLQDAQIAALAAGKVSGQLTDAQLASIAAAKVSGQLSDTQLASIAAAKVTGQMSDAQLLAISAAKVTGQITSTQITDGAILTAKLAAGSVTTATLAADAITADKIAAGAVTASEIAAGAVTTAKLAAGAVTANEIAAASITASQIAAATITSANIAAGTIAAGNIAAGTITASQIAAGTITSANIAAGTIAASNIAAGTITGNLLQANTITSTQLATSNLITASAQIADGVITNAKIFNLSADKIDAGTINTNRLNLNGLQLTNSGGQLSIANAGVDTSQVALQAITRVVAVNVATGINPTSNTWTTYSDVTLTVASGTSVRVDASMRVIMDVSSTFGASAELRIIRTVGGTDTTIYNTFLNTLTAANMTVEVGGNYGTATISYTMATTPSVIWVDIHGTSGSVKYTIQVRQNGGVTFENLTLVGTEIRR